MRPSSLVSRPEAQTHPYFPVEPARPGPGVLGQILRAGILAALLALAVGAPGTGSSTPDEVETQLTPTRVVKLPFVPFVAPAPAESEPQQSRPAAQTGGSGVAPRQVVPSQPEAQAPASGGGDTSVTYDNGSNDVSAGSGGSSVNNSANLDTRSGVSDTEGDPEPEP